jgi:hypothetical protein
MKNPGIFDIMHPHIENGFSYNIPYETGIGLKDAC